MTRRGLLVGAGLIAAPFIVRSRPSSVHSVAVPADRSYPRGDLLLAPDALYQQLFVMREPIRLLDATTLATYREQHIPGAVHVWWQDTMELNTPYYGKVLKPDDGDSNQGRRVRFLERLGIRLEMPVVVYGDTTTMQAARVCWFLRFLGINATVLDGGRAGWLGMNGPLSNDAPKVAETSLTSVTPKQDYYLTVQEMAERQASSGSQLIDLREVSERNRGPFRELTIPGAVLFPRSTLLDGNGLIRPAAELGPVLASTGIDLSADLLLIGPSGLDAAIPWLTFSLLGADPVVIADGGWQEWVDIPELPLAR